MDYPKSVPNVGLVNGKFVDENTATGQVGSLIPASWGNAVTDELLNVIRASGKAPAENDNGQVLLAIKAIVRDAVPPENIRTTLAQYGITDAYTKAEVDSALSNKASKATTLGGYGITDAYTKTQSDNLLSGKAAKASSLAGYGITDAYTKAETEQSFKWGFSISLEWTGYIAFPTWLGGLIIQWGRTTGSSVTFPYRFPNNLLDLTLAVNNHNSSNAINGYFLTTTATSTTGFTTAAPTSNLATAAVLKWLAFGN